MSPRPRTFRRAALAHGVKTVVSVSTDKAVKPVNAMGMTKALAEKVLLADGGEGPHSTRFVIVRYGKRDRESRERRALLRAANRARPSLPVTDPAMTRFLLTLPQAIDLVLHATVHGLGGHLYVRRMPAAL